MSVILQDHMVVAAEGRLLSYLTIAMLLSVGSSFDLERKLMLFSSPINSPTVFSIHLAITVEVEGVPTPSR